MKYKSLAYDDKKLGALTGDTIGSFYELISKCMEKTFVCLIVVAGMMMVAGCSEKAGNGKQEVKPDLNPLSLYYYDKVQKEVTFSDDGSTLLRFPHNSEIEEYVVPEHVTFIMERAFMGCQSLKKITIPASVKEVEMAAFENCHSLRYVYLYARLDTLPFRCFNDCEKMREIYLAQATPPVIEEYEEEESASLAKSFGEVNLNSCRIIVPKSAVPAYRKAYGWRLFKNIEPIVPHHVFMK